MIRMPNSLFLVSLILLATCQPAPSVAADDLIGAWRMEGAGYVIEFKKGGTYNVGASEFGQFQLEGTLLTLAIADEASFCPGKIGTYEIEVTEEGKLNWILIEDQCGARGGVADNSLWSPISP